MGWGGVVMAAAAARYFGLQFEKLGWEGGGGVAGRWDEWQVDAPESNTAA